jgi:quinolinate synthase
MYDKTVSEGAGQVRAISRLALNSTIKTGKIRPLYESIDDLFRKTGKEMKQAMRVVIASTASGGTGSGIILPLSMFIRDYVKEKYPNHTVVAYINTTADLKTICDVCVTSSSAVKIVNNIENKDILFIPDCNLGAHVAKQCPDKNIKLLNGGCPIHACVNPEEVKAMQKKYPEAELLVHPECVPEVCALADYIGSTSGIIDYAVKSDKKEFIIGTEISIAEHLQYMCPDKTFHILSLKLICPNMKSTTLVDVYNCLCGKGGEEILLDDKTIADAKKCIDEMIRLGE